VGFLQIWKRLELSRERCDLGTGKKKKNRDRGFEEKGKSFLKVNSCNLQRHSQREREGGTEGGIFWGERI
jgi:hypothetical protein